MESDRVAKEPVFQAHHVHSSAFGPPPLRRRTRDASDVSQQERLGFHTFRRGDLVEYANLLENESCVAAVYGVVYSLKKDSEQGCKLLILYDRSERNFFLGLWTEWRRQHAVPSPTDAESNETARTLDASSLTSMLEASISILHESDVCSSLQFAI